eukprot:1021025-Rhodomonas_salina.2
MDETASNLADWLNSFVNFIQGRMHKFSGFKFLRRTRVHGVREPKRRGSSTRVVLLVSSDTLVLCKDGPERTKKGEVLDSMMDFSTFRKFSR